MKHRSLGLYGRRPGVSAVGQSVQLRDYVADGVVDPFPLHPGAVDFTSGVAHWGMDGNDYYGDCGLAGDDHLCKATSWFAKEQPAGNIADTAVWPTVQQLIAEYLVYDNGQDAGVDLGQWLLYRMTHSLGPIPPIGAFAAVAIHGNEYAASMNAFGGLYTGHYVSSENEEEYQEGLPWSSTNTDWVGSHCTPHLYRNNTYGKLITWDLEQLFTWPWWGVAAEEAYVVLTPAQVNAPGGVFNGFKTAQLRADILKLHGITEAA